MLDFMFFRINPKRVCYIGGVVRMAPVKKLLTNLYSESYLA